VLAAVNAVPLPCGLAVGAGSVWVTDCTSPTVVRVDPVHVAVIDRIRLGELPDATQSVVVGAELGVGSRQADPSYVGLDPQTGVQTSRSRGRGGGARVRRRRGVGRGGVIEHSGSAPEAVTPRRGPRRMALPVGGGGYVWRR
jgi:hypothetical protein